MEASISQHLWDLKKIVGLIQKPLKYVDTTGCVGNIIHAQNCGSMKFRFDIDKSIAATAFVIQKAGGRYNIIHIVKTLYYANRISLVEYGRSITGDTLVSMDSGPVVSETYNLIKRDKWSNPPNLEKWAQFISEPEGVWVKVIKQPTETYLSGREIEVLERAYLAVSGVKGLLKVWSHAVFPEWTEVKGSSAEISPELILRLEHKTDDEIADIESEICSVNWLKSVA